jgi:CRP-like cAMP-binding protein
LYCIAKGTVAVRRSEPDTAPVLLRLAVAGQTFGYRNCLDDLPCLNSAKALSSSTVCHLDRMLLRRLLKRHSALGWAFQVHLSHDLSETETSLARLAWHSVRMRLARTLLWLQERYGALNARGEWEVPLPMTRRDLAELLAARPETLTRTLHAMEQEGLLSHTGSVIILRQPQRLKRELQFPAP